MRNFIDVDILPIFIILYYTVHKEGFIIFLINSIVSKNNKLAECHFVVTGRRNVTTEDSLKDADEEGCSPTELTSTLATWGPLSQQQFIFIKQVKLRTTDGNMKLCARFEAE